MTDQELPESRKREAAVAAAGNQSDGPDTAPAAGEAKPADANPAEAGSGTRQPGAGSQAKSDPGGRPGRPRGGRHRGPRKHGGGPHLNLADKNREPGPILGILEVLTSGSGFIRRSEAGYVPSKDDIYVGSRLIHRFGLRTGDDLAGIVGKGPATERVRRCAISIA